jgi:hypothetical protein
LVMVVTDWFVGFLQSANTQINRIIAGSEQLSGLIQIPYSPPLVRLNVCAFRIYEVWAGFDHEG